MNSKNRTILISAMLLILSAGNFNRLSDTSCIKPIHMITLLVMGASIGILIQALIQRFQQNK